MIGNDGVLLVDTQYEQLAPKIVAAIRKLSDKPILWIINTNVDADNIGGNEERASQNEPSHRVTPRSDGMNALTRRKLRCNQM